MSSNVKRSYLVLHLNLTTHLFFSQKKVCKKWNADRSNHRFTLTSAGWNRTLSSMHGKLPVHFKDVKSFYSKWAILLFKMICECKMIWYIQTADSWESYKIQIEAKEKTPNIRNTSKKNSTFSIYSKISFMIMWFICFRDRNGILHNKFHVCNNLLCWMLRITNMMILKTTTNDWNLSYQIMIRVTLHWLICVYRLNFLSFPLVKVLMSTYSFKKLKKQTLFLLLQN